MSTLFHSADTNLDAKESAFKFPLLPIGVANLKFPVNNSCLKTCLRNVWWCLFLVTLQSPTLQLASLYNYYANLTHLLETINTKIQFKEKLILEKTAPSQAIPLEYSSIARRVIFPAEHRLLTTCVQIVLPSSCKCLFYFKWEFEIFHIFGLTRVKIH